MHKANFLRVICVLIGPAKQGRKIRIESECSRNRNSDLLNRFDIPMDLQFQIIYTKYYMLCYVTHNEQ